MTFDQAQETFRTYKTCRTACTYLTVASQRKADEAISKDTFFNVIGEVANWLSASDEHLFGFELAKGTAAAWCKYPRGHPRLNVGHRGIKLCAEVA
jgi:hypothetical protein